MTQLFSVQETKLEGVKLISPFYATDTRGGFIKDYSAELLQKNGICHELKEVFYTISHKGVVRAIHFQRVKEQAKLVRVVKGSVFDVVVDLCLGSPTYGKWESFRLNDENCLELLIPKHFGHGYLVLEESIVSYKCDEIFYAEYDDGIRWDDPDIGIQWPTNEVERVILSDKDENLQSFQSFTKKLGL